MTEAQRHQILLEMLAQLGFVTVEKVVERLGISPATARRDINKLDESGKLKKVRNGAEAITQQRPRWTPMNLHQAQNHDEKVRIAKAASQLVNPGESVVINCGSTAFLLGREMCGKPVQIITNYLPLANYLIDQEHDSVIIMGGQYNKSQSITLSPQGSENSLYAGHWMFTSGKGLTAEGLYKTDMLTAMAEQKMLSVWWCWLIAVRLANARECFLAVPIKSICLSPAKMLTRKSCNNWKRKGSAFCVFKDAGGKMSRQHLTPQA